MRLKDLNNFKNQQYKLSKAAEISSEAARLAAEQVAEQSKEIQATADYIAMKQK